MILKKVTLYFLRAIVTECKTSNQNQEKYVICIEDAVLLGNTKKCDEEERKYILYRQKN